MDFKVNRFTFTERSMGGMALSSMYFISPGSTVNSVGLSSQPTHSAAKTFVEFGGVSKCSEARFLPLCDVANPRKVGRDHCVPLCSGPLWMSHYSFHPPTLQELVCKGGGKGANVPYSVLCRVFYLHN